jgi:hypothetical protein
LSGHIGAFHAVADVDLATLDHPCGDAAMTANGVVATGSERFLHAAAGRAFAAALKQRSADAESAVLQRNEVDTARDEISAKSFRDNFR